MTDLNARLKELAEEAFMKSNSPFSNKERDMKVIFGTLRQALREVLTMEPSTRMTDEAFALFDLTPVRAAEVYRAMNEARLKELGL